MDVHPRQEMVKVKTMKLRFVPLCLLLILQRQNDALTAADPSELPLRMLPNDPVVLDGGNVTLWCSLSKDVARNHTAADIEISAKKYPFDNPVPVTPVEIAMVNSIDTVMLNATTLQLFVRNVTADFDYHVIICTIADSNLSDMQVLQVGAPPQNVTITDYFVNNWKTFTFKWDVPKHQPFRTIYTSWYSQQSLESNDGSHKEWCSNCSPSWNTTVKCNRCTIPDVDLSRPITIYVAAQNLFGSTSTSLTVHNLRHYNKPGPPDVSGLTIDDVIDINGMYPTYVHLKPARRRVSVRFYTTVRCGSWQNEITTDHGADLDETIQHFALPAHSECRLTARCRSVDQNGAMSKYLGKETMRTFRTGDGVPRRPVETCFNCFYIEELDDRSPVTRSVVVYFKELPENDARGKVTSYKLKYWKANKPQNVSVLILNVPLVSTNPALSLETDHSYAVTIEASTTRGFNKTLEPNTIYIPRQSDVADPVANVTALEVNSTHVQVLWSPSSDSRFSYTVFWCYSYSYSYRCESELHRKTLNYTAQGLIVQFPHGRKGLFGVSKYRRETSHIITSNIAWTNCVYSVIHAPPTPSVRDVNLGDSVTLELTTMQCRPTGEKFGYAYVYFITVSEPEQHNGTSAGYGGVLRLGVEAGNLSKDCYKTTWLKQSAGELGGCYNLTGLQPSTNYNVSVYSITSAGVPSKITTIAFRTESLPLLNSNQLLALFLPVGTVLLFLVALGLLVSIKFFYKRCSNCDVLIKVPNFAANTDKTDRSSDSYSKRHPHEEEPYVNYFKRSDYRPRRTFIDSILPKLNFGTSGYFTTRENDESQELSSPTSVDSTVTATSGLNETPGYARADCTSTNDCDRSFVNSPPGKPHCDGSDGTVTTTCGGPLNSGQNWASGYAQAACTSTNDSDFSFLHSPPGEPHSDGGGNYGRGST